MQEPSLRKSWGEKNPRRTDFPSYPQPETLRSCKNSRVWFGNQVNLIYLIVAHNIPQHFTTHHLLSPIAMHANSWHVQAKCKLHVEKTGRIRREIKERWSCKKCFCVPPTSSPISPPTILTKEPSHHRKKTNQTTPSPRKTKRPLSTEKKPTPRLSPAATPTPKQTNTGPNTQTQKQTNTHAPSAPPQRPKQSKRNSRRRSGDRGGSTRSHRGGTSSPSLL